LSFFQVEQARIQAIQAADEVSVGVQMNAAQMHKYLVGSHCCIDTAVRSAAKSRKMDEYIVQKGVKSRLSVQMEPLYLFSGAPRKRFESLINEEMGNRLKPAMELKFWVH
jgi:hypothetical protein